MSVLKGDAPAGERNFYNKDETLKKILGELLPADFLAYADSELSAFGRLAANEIDERARHTDREGAQQLEKYDRIGQDI